MARRLECALLERLMKYIMHWFMALTFPVDAAELSSFLRLHLLPSHISLCLPAAYSSFMHMYVHMCLCLHDNLVSTGPGPGIMWCCFHLHRTQHSMLVFLKHAPEEEWELARKVFRKLIFKGRRNVSNINFVMHNVRKCKYTYVNTHTVHTYVHASILYTSHVHIDRQVGWSACVWTECCNH